MEEGAQSLEVDGLIDKLQPFPIRHSLNVSSQRINECLKLNSVLVDDMPNASLPAKRESK